MAEPMETLDEPGPHDLEQPSTHNHETEKPSTNDRDAALSDSDSDTGSDSDSEDEAQVKLQLQTLEEELGSNPSNYDAQVQYIKLLRKMGELEKLRKAREMMSQVFPLSPEMWQEWAKDETSLLAGSGRAEAVEAIERLYERGISDYLSVSLWCDYLNFVRDYDSSVRQCSSTGVSKARNLFERAITAAGLHVNDGNKIWDAYREFEQAVLHTLDESNCEVKEKQVQRIRSVFHRKLSVPLADMTSNLLAYKSWELEQGNSVNANSREIDDIISHVDVAYKKAVDMYKSRAVMENEISNLQISDPEKLPVFKRYLKLEESSGDPGRVQILYERAIVEYPVSSDLWLHYLRYLDKTLKGASIVRSVYSRAVKNCPWIGDIWVRYLLFLEQAHATEEEISAVFEKGLQSTFSAYEEYLELFLTRIDGLRRRFSLAGEVQDFDYALIRDTFQRASDYFSASLKGSDSLLHLHVYWSRLEISLGKDIPAARGVWESFLRISGSAIEAWKSYVAMEIENKNIKEARSIYRRCYAKRFTGTGSEDICHCWLRFEREFGTLEDYDFAVQKVSPRLEELRLFRSQQEAKSNAPQTEQKQISSKKDTREKRKHDSDSTYDQSPAKRQKSATKGLEESKKNGGKAKNTARDERKGVDSNHDGKDTTTEQYKEEAIKEKLEYTDQCTAFISNLSYQANDENLRSFFSDVGGVASIRILKDRFTGKSRGLAYVDFADDDHLAAAVAKNKQSLMGKKLNIARSDPKKAKSKVPDEQGKKPQAEKGKSPNIQLKGKNTFAAPRAITRRQTVKPLSWTKPEQKANEGEEEKPKSNDEFRKMFIKSSDGVE
ncbi:Squamous cell carcinoma antigen recognized by T-cells 3-like protein [Drosera capensis]